MEKSGEESVTIILRATPALVKALDEKCGGRSTGGRGNHGGRAWFILTELHKMLKVPLPKTPEKAPLPSLDHVNLEWLDVKTRYIVSLHKNGVALKDIPAMLRDKRIPTPQNGEWNERTIRQILTRVAKRAEVTNAREKGATVEKGRKGFSQGAPPPPPRKSTSAK